VRALRLRHVREAIAQGEDEGALKRRCDRQLGLRESAFSEHLLSRASKARSWSALDPRDARNLESALHADAFRRLLALELLSGSKLPVRI
jgi:hypothetical protein